VPSARLPAPVLATTRPRPVFPDQHGAHEWYTGQDESGAQ